MIKKVNDVIRLIISQIQSINNTAAAIRYGMHGRNEKTLRPIA